jgi:hypothetical protein
MENISRPYITNRKFVIVSIVFLLIALIQTVFDIDLNPIGGYDFGQIGVISLNSLFLILIITLFSILTYIFVEKNKFIYSISSSIIFIFIWYLFAGLRIIFYIFTKAGIFEFFNIVQLIFIPFISIIIGGIFGFIGAVIGWIVSKFKR